MVATYSICLNSTSEEQSLLLRDVMARYDQLDYYFKTRIDTQGRFTVEVYQFE